MVNVSDYIFNTSLFYVDFYRNVGLHEFRILIVYYILSTYVVLYFHYVLSYVRLSYVHVILYYIYYG